MVSKALSALIYGAGLISALPHAGHHGHCGSKCETSSVASLAVSTSAAAVSSVAAATAVSSVVASSAVLSTPAVATTAAVVASSTGVKATADAGCTFTDAAKAASGVKNCKNVVLSGIAVPAGETLDLSDAADGTTFTFEGTITFGYKEWAGPLVRFAGSDITVQGADGHLIDAGGAKWWDGKGTNGGKDKPKFFYAHDLIDSTIKGLNVKNTPVQGFSINSSKNLKVIDITIDNTDGDVENGGHNTDAFDVGSSTGVYISGANIKNQDDCLAINSGTDISFTGGTCSGGHGISIGSVGGRDDNDVANIVISDSTVTNSDNGIRIKTVSGATGSVKNVTYSNIKLSSINKYGIVIEQDYENGSPTGTPTSGVPITDLTVNGVTGTVGSKAEEVYILCASCSSWKWSGVAITGGEKSAKCEGVPSGALC